MSWGIFSEEKLIQGDFPDQGSAESASGTDQVWILEQCANHPEHPDGFCHLCEPEEN